MQFSIRALIIVIALAAICCVFLDLFWLLEFYLRYWLAVSLVLLFGSWFAVQRCVVRFVMRSKFLQRRYATTRILFACGMLTIAATFYLVWARYRWYSLCFEGEFPYPDTMLLNFCNWLDARNPPPPGMLKIHGEFNTVLLILEIAINALCLVTGLLLGVSMRPDQLFGLAHLHSLVVKMTKWFIKHLSNK